MRRNWTLHRQGSGPKRQGEAEPYPGATRAKGRFVRVVRDSRVFLAPNLCARHAPNGRAVDHPLVPRLTRSLYDSPSTFFQSPDNPDNSDKREENAAKSVAFQDVRVG
jgi:hypothetical protein